MIYLDRFLAWVWRWFAPKPVPFSFPTALCAVCGRGPFAITKAGGWRRRHHCRPPVPPAPAAVRGSQDGADLGGSPVSPAPESEGTS